VLCVAAAFVQPGTPLRASSQGVPMSRAVAPEMSAETALATITQTVADAGDFGGSTIPVIGLGLLAAIIALLAGPVEE